MTADLAAAALVVFIAAHGVQIMAVGLILLVWSAAWLWSPSRALRRRNTELAAQLGAARRALAEERHNATVAMRLLNRAVYERALLAGQVDRMREQAQAIDDRVACMQLDLRTDWERT